MCVLTVPPLHSLALPLNSFPLGPLLPSCLGFLSRVYMCVSEGVSESKLELLALWMEELFAEPWTVLLFGCTNEENDTHSPTTINQQ